MKCFLASFSLTEPTYLASNARIAQIEIGKEECDAENEDCRSA